MTLETLSKLDERQLKFHFCAAGAIMRKFVALGQPRQVRFWMQVCQAIERGRVGRPAKNVDLDNLFDADLETVARTCAGLAGGQVSATTEFFRELAAVLETELHRRRRDVIALERLR
jgi:hypothetical protein